ncbi:AAA family ATPase [Desulfurobacterium sp.]
MGFNTVVGHTEQLHIIKELIERNAFPSSVLFSGPQGIGKKLIALETAKLLTKNPFEIKVIGEDKPPTINEIRDSASWLFKKPQYSSKKVLIIDNGETMRMEAANALLKTLEEPPPYATIILITSNENHLLPTIRSRCKTFRFGKLTEQQVKTVLQNLGIQYDERIIKICGNSPGKAIALTNSKVPDLISELIKLLKEKKLYENITSFSANFSSMSREETELFIDSLELLLSDKKALLTWFEPLEKGRTFLKFYGRPRNVIEWILINIAENGG